MARGLREILNAPPLRIRHLAGRSETLVVCFSGVGERRNYPPGIEFHDLASDNGKNHVLFVEDESRCWLNTDGMAETIVETVRETASRLGVSRIVALGNSMGGTMALLLSQFLDFDVVLAFAPQYSVDPVEVPEERRWVFFRNRITRYRFPRVEGLRPDRTRYFIVHGAKSIERIHALRFPKMRGIAHFILPGKGHKLAASLKESGELSLLVRHGLAGRRGRFRRCVFALGGEFRSVFEGKLRHAQDQLRDSA